MTEPVRLDFDPAAFHSIVVESSGAAPIRMTGVRDLERQERELCEIYGIHDPQSKHCRERGCDRA